MQRIIALVAAGSVSLSGCAPRSEPKTLARPAGDSFDIIAYRTLTRDDFRGPVAEHSLTEASHATTPRCTSISVTPREVVTRTQATTGGTFYVATLDNPVFFATFHRGCSWPSPDESHPDAHVLEHEQIHFAIGEVEARRLNGRIEGVLDRIRSVGTDRDSVSRRAALELQAILKEAEESCLARDILFDDQVRGGDRVRQRQWFQKISADLEQTEMFARGPQTMIPVAVASAPPPAAPSPSAPPATTAPPRRALTPTAAPTPTSQPLAAPYPPPPPVPAPAPAAPPPAPVPPAAPQPAVPSAPSSPSSSGAFPD